MFSALRIRDYRLLASGQLLSSLGDWFLLLAAPYYVLDLTGSTMASGFSLVAGTVPALLVGPLAGAFVDRWNRLYIMVGTDLVRMAAVSLMMLVDSSGEVWLIYVALILESTMSQLFGPASAALLPELVGRGPHLQAANSLSALIVGVIRLVGGPLGGALYAAFGFVPLVAFDAFTYLCSALFLVQIRYRPLKAGRSTGAKRGKVRRLLGEVRAGATHVWRDTWLLALLAASALSQVGTSAMNVTLVPYMDKVLHASAQTLGLLFGAFGAGFLLGVPICRALSKRFTDRTVLAGSLAWLAGTFALTFNVHVIAWDAVLFATLGPPMVCFGITSGTFVARHTPDDILGRVSSTNGFLQAAASLSGMVVGSLLSQELGIVATMNLACVIIALSAVTALLMPRRQPTHIPDGAPPLSETA